MVLQELPVKVETSVHSRHAVTKNTLGEIQVKP
jgi:hypothetical protein